MGSIEDRIRRIRLFDRRYITHAYLFTLNYLGYLDENDLGDKKEQRNDLTSVGCFMKHLPDYAKNELGPLTGVVFRYWGLHRPTDMGNILENLAEHKLTRWGNGEQAEDFEAHPEWPGITTE